MQRNRLEQPKSERSQSRNTKKAFTDINLCENKARICGVHLVFMKPRDTLELTVSTDASCAGITFTKHRARSIQNT